MGKRITPATFQQFQDLEEYRNMAAEWGLISPKAKELKQAFVYKNGTTEETCTLIGYVDRITAVIQFADQTLHAIHFSHLKEMQTSKFQSSSTDSTSKKPTKVEIPEEKVKLSAIIAGFTTKPNPFSDHDDEILLYDNVSMIDDLSINFDQAWSSLSASLKKLELQVGDQIQFEAKLVRKKLNKENDVKINNPSKIQKQET